MIVNSRKCQDIIEEVMLVQCTVSPHIMYVRNYSVYLIGMDINKGL